MNNSIVLLNELKQDIDNNSTMDVSNIESYKNMINDIILSLDNSITCIGLKDGETCKDCYAYRFADDYM